jgi:hypothetical protein
MKKRPEEESELAFEACLKDRGFDEPEHQPTVEGKTKRLDFRVYMSDTPLFFEVKEFKKEKEIEEGITGGCIDLYEPIYRKIEDALEQIAQYGEYCCSLVLYARDASFVSLDPQSVLGGFLGPLSLKVFADPVSGETHEVSFWDASQGGYSLDAETLTPRNKYLSAIIALEKFPIGTFLTDGKWEKMRDLEVTNLGRALNDEETCDLITKFLAENPDHGKIIMRALVFEHPDADHQLPREIFTGPYDERFGREGDRMVRVFLGSELQKLKDAGVYPATSPLFKKRTGQ